MSARARHARRLSSILCRESGVFVRVQYFQQVRRYGVHWTGGPHATEMYAWAIQHADEIHALDVHSLDWLRTEPAQRTVTGEVEEP
ncbi:hypothetical protein JOF56_001781 [Kibdelosporangium banguiense]|uniref:Uncharacterized protein n=1 Tax=Kibdelosporangium banguiense TaxID=1365924 RepID=A0ABS4TAN2_9PSEU|nr:hypothetical protein [Kibdelosporangium banguiense]MBP2321396.1 hypothetical protein [Kibdelosporangium banguiense]